MTLLLLVTFAAQHLVPLKPYCLVASLQHLGHFLPGLKGGMVVDQLLSLVVIPGGTALVCLILGLVLDHAWTGFAVYSWPA